MSCATHGSVCFALAVDNYIPSDRHHRIRELLLSHALWDSEPSPLDDTKVGGRNRSEKTGCVLVGDCGLWSLYSGDWLVEMKRSWGGICSTALYRPQPYEMAVTPEFNLPVLHLGQATSIFFNNPTFSTRLSKHPRPQIIGNNASFPQDRQR
jgi:hypothetical protein